MKMPDLIDLELVKYKEVLRKAYQQAVICGDVILRINEKGELEIANPFKGCGCGETDLEPEKAEK